MSKLNSSKSVYIVSDRRHNKLQQIELSKAITEVDLRNLYEKNKMSQFEIGQFYGVSQQTVANYLRKFNIKIRGKSSRNQFGPNSRMWKKTPSYRTLHKRVEYHRGKPKFCESCKTNDPTKIYQWANISGHYLAVDDFRRLCLDCHNKETKRDRDSRGRFH